MLKSIFYSAHVGEFLRIALNSLLYKDSNEKAMELLNIKKAQGGTIPQVKKSIIQNQPKT